MNDMKFHITHHMTSIIIIHTWENFIIFNACFSFVVAFTMFQVWAVMLISHNYTVCGLDQSCYQHFMNHYNEIDFLITWS